MFIIFIGRLTIGIPSVTRKNGMTYIAQTIQSLVSNTTPTQRATMVIVVFLADIDIQSNEIIKQQLMKLHEVHLQSGFIQIVTVDKSLYPPLEGLKRNFGDSPDRVGWRSKQAVDYAFLLMYAQGISKYYLQLEDDVISASDYSGKIMDYIDDQTEPWVVLEFSTLGFIGKLFRDSDLSRLAQYLWMFYNEQPVDWLIDYFRLSLTQKDRLINYPSIFQHMGVVSSYSNKGPNNLTDAAFYQEDIGAPRTDYL